MEREYAARIEPGLRVMVTAGAAGIGRVIVEAETGNARGAVFLRVGEGHFDEAIGGYFTSSFFQIRLIEI